MATKAELELKIKTLKSAGKFKEAAVYEEQLAGMGSPAKAAVGGLGIPEDVSEEEFNKSNSKFCNPGLHLSEIQTVEPDNPGSSIKITFTTVEEGENYGKEGKISTSVLPEKGLWKWKEAWKACGIEPILRNGKINIQAMMDELPGKQCLVLWEMVESNRDTKYPKATKFLPIGTEESELF